MNRRALLMHVLADIGLLALGVALLIAANYTSHGSVVFNRGSVILLTLAFLVFSFVIGPTLAFAGEASVLWLSAVLQRRKNPRRHIPSFGELYRCFFLREPLRMVNPPPDEP